MIDRISFSADDTHEIAFKGSNQLIADSEGLGWKNMYASFAQEKPWAEKVPAIPHLGLAFNVRYATRVHRRVEGAGENHTAQLDPRQFSVLPARVPAFWKIEGQPHILLIYLRDRLIDEVAEQVFDTEASRVEFAPRLAAYDPLVEQLARRILDALVSRDPAYTGLYIDTLAHTIVAHLIHGHSNRSGPDHANRLRGGSEKLYRAVDLVEDNISQPLSLNRMAQAAGLSTLYFIKAFRRQFGATPHQYVMRRRVEHAERLIQESDHSNAEIALMTGFSSQSHFSSVFKKIVGVTPTAYRNQSS